MRSTRAIQVDNSTFLHLSERMKAAVGRTSAEQAAVYIVAFHTPVWLHSALKDFSLRHERVTLWRWKAESTANRS